MPVLEVGVATLAVSLTLCVPVAPPLPILELETWFETVLECVLLELLDAALLELLETLAASPALGLPVLEVSPPLVELLVPVPARALVAMPPTLLSPDGSPLEQAPTATVSQNVACSLDNLVSMPGSLTQVSPTQQARKSCSLMTGSRTQHANFVDSTVQCDCSL